MFHGLGDLPGQGKMFGGMDLTSKEPLEGSPKSVSGTPGDGLPPKGDEGANADDKNLRHGKSPQEYLPPVCSLARVLPASTKDGAFVLYDRTNNTTYGKRRATYAEAAEACDKANEDWTGDAWSKTAAPRLFPKTTQQDVDARRGPVSVPAASSGTKGLGDITKELGVLASKKSGSNRVPDSIKAAAGGQTVLGRDEWISRMKEAAKKDGLSDNEISGVLGNDAQSMRDAAPPSNPADDAAYQRHVEQMGGMEPLSQAEWVARRDAILAKRKENLGKAVEKPAQAGAAGVVTMPEWKPGQKMPADHQALAKAKERDRKNGGATITDVTPKGRFGRSFQRRYGRN